MGGLLPASAPRTLHLELVPSMHGVGLEPWVGSELVMWENEKACMDNAMPVSSVMLMRIKQVKHLTKHDNGCSVRLRLQLAESKEACEETFLHSSSQESRDFSDAL